MAPRKDNIGEHTIALELENIGWLKMQKQYWNKKITESKEKETREEFQQLLTPVEASEPQVLFYYCCSDSYSLIWPFSCEAWKVPDT